MNWFWPMAPAQEPRISRGVRVALVGDLQGTQQLAAEEGGPPALVGQGGQRREHGIAALALAEVRFDPPQRHHDLGGHPEAGLDLPQQRRVQASSSRPRSIRSVADHAAAILGEGHPALGLAPIGLDHRRDRAHAGKRGVEHGRVDPLLARLAAQARPATSRRSRRRQARARPTAPGRRRARRAPCADRTDRMWPAGSPSA